MTVSVFDAFRFACGSRCKQDKRAVLNVGVELKINRWNAGRIFKVDNNVADSLVVRDPLF